MRNLRHDAVECIGEILGVSAIKRRRTRVCCITLESVHLFCLGGNLHTKEVLAVHAETFGNICCTRIVPVVVLLITILIIATPCGILFPTIAMHVLGNVVKTYLIWVSHWSVYIPIGHLYQIRNTPLVGAQLIVVLFFLRITCATCYAVGRIAVRQEHYVLLYALTSIRIKDTLCLSERSLPVSSAIRCNLLNFILECCCVILVEPKLSVGVISLGIGREFHQSNLYILRALFAQNCIEKSITTCVGQSILGHVKSTLPGTFDCRVVHRFRPIKDNNDVNGVSIRAPNRVSLDRQFKVVGTIPIAINVLVLLNCLVVDWLQKILRGRILRIRIGNARANREQPHERNGDSHRDERPERTLTLNALPHAGKSLASQAPA